MSLGQQKYLPLPVYGSKKYSAESELMAAVQLREKISLIQEQWCKQLAPRLGLGHWGGVYPDHLYQEDKSKSIQYISNKMMSDSEYSLKSYGSSSGVSSMLSSSEMSSYSFKPVESVPRSLSANSNSSSNSSLPMRPKPFKPMGYFPNVYSPTPMSIQKQRIYECKECGNVFQKYYKLKIHMRIHDAVKCRHCHGLNIVQEKKKFSSKLKPLPIINESEVFF